MKKKLLGLGAVAVCLALAGGCGSSDEPPASSPEGGAPTSRPDSSGVDASDPGPIDSGMRDTSALVDSSVLMDSSAVDAGNDTGAQGDAGDGGPKTGALTFRGCAALTPCGGAVPGTWDFTGGCLEDPLASFRAACPGLVERSARGTLQGSVAFTGGSASGAVSRTLQISVVADVTFPSSCVAPATCTLVPLLIGGYLPGATATCSGTTSCLCTITYNRSENASTTYTTAGNSIAFANGETFDYCITGARMQYRQTATAPGQPADLTAGLLSLERR